MRSACRRRFLRFSLTTLDRLDWPMAESALFNAALDGYDDTIRRLSVKKKVRS